jgi:hypothetical protein
MDLNNFAIQGIVMNPNLSRLFIGVCSLGVCLFLLAQGFLAQLLWKTIAHASNDNFGWKFGFIYVLFCIFISGSRLLSLWLETPLSLAKSWGCKDLSQIDEPACHVGINLLGELFQLKKGVKPSLYLIPCDEINACSFTFNQEHALFITRGSFNYLSRDQLKLVIVRQLIQLQQPFFRLKIAFVIMVSGFCGLFLSGQNLISRANFGRLEVQNKTKKGSPFYFIGLIPLIIGLPSWLISRIFLSFLDKKEVLSIDTECTKSKEAKENFRLIMNAIQAHPHHDMPASLLVLRTLGLHNEGFLESLLPTQPSIEERLKNL